MQIILRIIYLGGILLWTLYVLAFPTWIGRMQHGIFGLQGAKFDHRTNRAPLWCPPTGHGALINAPVRWPWRAKGGDRVELDVGSIVGRWSAGFIVLGLIVGGVNWIRPSRSRFLPSVTMAISLALLLAWLMMFALAVASMGLAVADGVVIGFFALAVAAGVAYGVWRAPAEAPIRSSRLIVNRRQMKCLLGIVVCLACVGALMSSILLMRKANEAKRRNDAITWIEEHDGSTSYPDGSDGWPTVSFCGAAIGDESLATIAEHMRPLGAIGGLDLRDTQVTGRTLAVLSRLEQVRRIVLDPAQTNLVSIEQLNQCPSIYGIKLTGDVTEDAVMELVPVLRKWNRPGTKKLVVDTLSAEGLSRLTAEAPNLSGVHTAADNYWHPIAMRAGPR